MFCLCDNTPIDGCCKVDSDCDDGTACTLDICDPETGECANVVGDCIPDDAAPCLLYVCEPGVGCVEYDKKCDDGDPCTLDDHCDAATGECAYAPPVSCGVCEEVDPANCECVALDCDDGSECSNDSCDPESGCVHEAAFPGECMVNHQCDDGNACTVDSCSLEDGCWCICTS